MKIFISYSHKQAPWVTADLLPCLDHGRAEALIDIREFGAGRTVLGQMDAVQDRADLTVAVLTEEYMRSDYCRHELERAVARDPEFKTGGLVPVLLEPCSLPACLQGPKKPLWVDLRGKRRDPAAWKLLMEACGADLGLEAPGWLKARDKLLDHLESDESVNLVTHGNEAWQNLLEHVLDGDAGRGIGCIDVQNPLVTTRRALIEEIMRQCGVSVAMKRGRGEDLVALSKAFSLRSGPAWLALKHFDFVNELSYWDIPLFNALRYLISDERKLLVLLHSRVPFVQLLPPDHPLSRVANVFKIVEL